MRYIMLFCLFLSYLIGSGQQQKRISGKVLSAETEKPVAGATIRIVNSNASSLTDNNGIFNIECSRGQILNISHAEFQTYSLLVDSVNDTGVQIYLKPANKTLSTIVVNTGYKKVDPGKTTGSYIIIDSNLLTRSTGPNILSHLQDVIPSLYFDKRRNSIAPLQIRGISTLGYASTMPLIILNNFPYEGDINNINPDDIESISVLRDAAAYAIWGARAGNGVIVISTKQGKYNKKLHVSFSSNFSISPKQDLFKSDNFSSQDYITVEKYLFENGFYDGLFYPENYQPVSPVVAILEKEKSGLISSNEATRQISTLAQQDVRNDITKYLLRHSFLQQYAVSIAGGGSKATHYASIGYYNELSNKVATKNHRITATLSNTFKPIDKLEISTEILLSQTYAENDNSFNYGDMLIMGTSNYWYPYALLADDQGNPLPVDAYFRSSYIDTVGNGKLLDWRYKPLEDFHYTNNNSRNTALNASIGLTYQFTSYLNAQLKYQYQNDKLDNMNLRTGKSFEARNYVNLFSQMDGGVVKYIIPPGGILDSRFATSEANNLRAQLNFDKQFNAFGRLSISAGAETRSFTNKSSADRVYGYTDNLNFTPVDYANPYPSYNDVYGDMYIPMGTGFTATKDNYVSGFATADYNYEDLFSLSGSFRYDASNLFGVETNKKGVPLWSAGGAFRISSLKNYDIGWLPLLRVRLTYGYGGNVSHSVSALTTLSYGAAADQRITNLPYTYINTFPNPNLQWEKVATTNMGIDFGIAKNRIKGSLDFYKKMSYKVLYPRDMDPTLGTSFLTYNSANLKSLGLDFTISATLVHTSNFEWSGNLNLSYIKTKISKILYSNIITTGFVSNGLYLMPIEGYEPFQVVSFQWAGLDKSGNPQGILNGKPSINYDSILKVPINQQVLNGSAVPHYFGNFRNDLSIYKFNISFNINFKMGYFFRKPSLDYYDLFYRGMGLKEFDKRWQREGDELQTNVPSMIYPYDSKRDKLYQYAAVNALPGDYIKLQDVRLSYLPFKTSNKILRTFQVFAMFSNLNLIIWKANKLDIDPDYPSGKTDRSVYSFGIKANF